MVREFQIVTDLKSKKEKKGEKKNTDLKMVLSTFFTPLKYFHSNGRILKLPRT